jgi:hypothetical protein
VLSSRPIQIGLKLDGGLIYFWEGFDDVSEIQYMNLAGLRNISIKNLKFSVLLALNRRQYFLQNVAEYTE